jgi:ABC-type multidrug transport system ATPase subunit
VTNASLVLDRIHKGYGDRPILKGFSAEFEPGRIAALVGPNGAGKTTLLRIIASLQRPDSGTVSSGRVLFFGGAELMPLRGTVDSLRQALGLAAGGDLRKLAALSRGELQRIGLDVAFSAAPSVLLLDEPWGPLDPEGRATLNEELVAAAAGRVILCSTHDLDEVARVADDVVFLRDGLAERWNRETTPFERESLMRGFRARVVS